jgi:pyruvate,water dikinase
MVQHHLPVPEAMVLPVEAMEAFLSHNRLDSRAQKAVERGGKRRLASLRSALCAGTFPEPMEIAIVERARTLGLGQVDGGVAVRSSAVDEDDASRSFAGQYATVLNVLDEKGLLEAIKTCWASWFSEEALSYRQQGDALPQSAGMAVLLQRQVRARISGVLFTINPLTGSWREMVLEACWGQGEALVSGKIRPDRVLLRRPRKTPKPVQRVLARVQVEALEFEAGGQTRALYPAASGGLEWRTVEAVGDRVLGEEDARRIGRIGLRAEALAGCPQDLEWAMDERGEILVLQSRPISASPPKRGQSVLWTRRFFGERWTDLATPMGWSIVQEALHEFISYPETARRHLGGEEPTQLVRGRPYFNVTVFRHLLFKFPGAPPPRFLLEFLPPEEERRWLRRRAAGPGFLVYGAILKETLAEKRWKRFRWNPLSNPKAWERFEGELRAELPGLRALDGNPSEQLEQACELLRGYIKIHICSLLFANILYQIAESAVPPELRRDLLRCPVENRTQEVNRDLYDLSQGGDKAAFIARHGHRASTSSWEIFGPRWVEDPSALDRLIEPYKEGVLADPREVLREQQRAGAEALSRLRASSRTPAGWGLVKLVVLTRRYLQLREDQRYVFDELLFAMKKILQRQGEALLGEGGSTLVAYLTKEELLALDQGKAEQSAMVETALARREQWAAYARGPAPPVFLSGEEAPMETEDAGRLQGLGISPGTHTGRVRILNSPEEAWRIELGDILVATATDPGWTPLFLVAGAVVLELGSMLSHGAVLAREYGLPAVVNVSSLLSRLEDGQIITVDGTRGVVWLEPRE